MIKSSNLQFISSMVKTNQFNDGVEGLTIFVEKKNEDGSMNNIFIRDDGKIFRGLEDIFNTDNVA